MMQARRALRSTPTRGTKSLVLALALIGSAACNQDSSDDGGSRSEGGDSCSGDCETREWPRLIVGLVGPAANRANVEADHETGPLHVNSGLCPSELPDGFTCSFTASAVGETTVKVMVPDREPATKTIDLGEFNYCGRDIAYVEVVVGDDDVSFVETEYISPCERK